MTGQTRDSYRVIAARTGRDRTTIRAEHIAAGTHTLPVTAIDGRTFPGSYAGRFERAKKVQALREAGATIRGIASELRISTNTVQHDLAIEWTRTFRRRR